MKRPRDSEKKRLAPLLTHGLFGFFILGEFKGLSFGDSLLSINPIGGKSDSKELLHVGAWVRDGKRVGHRYAKASLTDLRPQSFGYIGDAVVPAILGKRYGQSAHPSHKIDPNQWTNEK